MIDNKFRLTAGWCALFSMLLAFSTVIFSAVLLDFDAALFNAAVSDNAAIVLPLLAVNPALAWWPSIFDLFGFYLLLLPLLVYLYRLLKAESPDWITLITLSGLTYILLGAMGASILAVVFSGQAAAYAVAADSARHTHTAIFEAFGAAIQRGVWGIVDPILAGVWWLGLGLFLRRRLSVLGWYTILLGIINFVGGISAALGINAVASFCLNAYFILAPIWAGWLGILLLRKHPSMVKG